jgi:hypothetical protein
MATIGRNAAVVQLPSGVRLRGRIAWLAWVALHIVTLVGHRNRLATLANLLGALPGLAGPAQRDRRRSTVTAGNRPPGAGARAFARNLGRPTCGFAATPTIRTRIVKHVTSQRVMWRLMPCP